MKRKILTYFLYIKETIKQLLKRLILKFWPNNVLEGFVELYIQISMTLKTPTRVRICSVNL